MKRERGRDPKLLEQSPPEANAAREGIGLMMAGARRLRALAGKEQPAMTADQRPPLAEPAAGGLGELLEQTVRELREIEAEISRLLTRKRLLLILRHHLAGLPPGAPVLPWFQEGSGDGR